MSRTGYRRVRRTVPTPSLDRIVIVGGGRAGVAAAEELRHLGFAGELTILCDEPEAPYDRPACSKGILNGRQRPTDIALPMRAGVEVSWRLGRRAVHLDGTARVVYTDTDEEFPYDGLVIATGAHPVVPSRWPRNEPGLYVLHGLKDAWALRQELRTADRVAVVGGGLTGCETASAVRSLARDCVLIDSRRGVMTQAIGEVASEYVTEEVARDGVQMLPGRRVWHVERCRRGWLLHLDDGHEVTADVVVATLGERPDTGWLESMPNWDLTDGILCDQSLRVVGAEGVVAAGTVARWPNLRYDGIPTRCGQWIAALEQGHTAARTLLAGDRATAPSMILPRFWSDQFGLRIQVCGRLPEEADVAVTRMRPHRRDVARAGVLVSYTRDGVQFGIVAINAPHAFTALTRSMLATVAAATPSETVVPIGRHLTAVA